MYSRHPPKLQVNDIDMIHNSLKTFPTLQQNVVIHHIKILQSNSAGHHSLVSRVQDLRTGGPWFDPWAWPTFFPRIDD